MLVGPCFFVSLNTPFSDVLVPFCLSQGTILVVRDLSEGNDIGTLKDKFNGVTATGAVRFVELVEVNKINRSHTHTHTPTENSTLDTDTHTHDKGRSE